MNPKIKPITKSSTRQSLPTAASSKSNKFQLTSGTVLSRTQSRKTVNSCYNTARKSIKIIPEFENILTNATIQKVFFYCYNRVYKKGMQQGNTKGRNSDLSKEVDFIQKYSYIRADKKAPFQERMEFDIYKRATQTQRTDQIKNIAPNKLSKEQSVKLLTRLEKDTKRRQESKKILENITQIKPQINEPQKKLSRQESDELYQRLMKSKEVSEALLHEKQTIQEELKTQEELKSMESFINNRGIFYLTF